MLDLKQQFIHWYFDEFQLSDLYKSMADISESSTWHRERNVATHTDMVVSQYLSINLDGNSNNVQSRTLPWDSNKLNGAFACAFHDVGKPKARTHKYSDTRGDYYSYGGHELISARLWENFAVINWKMLQDKFNLDVRDIYNIGWMIENHLPWKISKQYKMDNIAQTINAVSTHYDFTNVLWADNTGRISDKQNENENNAASWIDKMKERCEKFIFDNKKWDNDAHTVIMLIGTSGSGKSTSLTGEDTGFGSDIKYHSLDTLRLQLYSSDYAEAFSMSCADKEFSQKAQRHYIDLLKSNVDICVDNTNLSKKRRRFYLTEAKKRGYNTLAILYPVDLQTVLNRQNSRSDKCVPEEAVKRQYFSLSYPDYGEFDSVTVHATNLPK